MRERERFTPLFKLMVVDYLFGFCSDFMRGRIFERDRPIQVLDSREAQFSFV
jgi:hypothetical protein